jgi:hypothetical protein
MISTKAEVVISVSEEYFEKMPSWILASLDSGSNNSAERKIHSQEQLFPKTSTEEGRQIDENDDWGAES